MQVRPERKINTGILFDGWEIAMGGRKRFKAIFVLVEVPGEFMLDQTATGGIGYRWGGRDTLVLELE